MKLNELFTPAESKAAQQEADKKRAQKASDLKSPLDAVRDAVGLEAKKAAGRLLASKFTAGGKAKFLTGLDRCKSAGEVDRLCYNAALRGEGNGAVK